MTRTPEDHHPALERPNALTNHLTEKEPVMEPSIPVAMFLPNGEVQEVRLPALPRVGDRIDYGLDEKNKSVGSGVVTAVEWDITNLQRPTVGILVGPRQ